MYEKWIHFQDKVRFIRYRAMYAAASAASVFLKNSPQFCDLWIVAERGTDARDNGYHFFRYVRQTAPDRNVWYIISKNSPDRKKVEELGNVINYRSFRHFLALILSEVKISTHIVGYSPDLYLFLKYEKKGKIRGKSVLLQHGIIKEPMPFYYRKNTSPALFVCSAVREYEFVKNTFGHPEGVVRLLGLCRYDSLPLTHEKKKRGRTVLLMPTWRFGLDEMSVSQVKKSLWFRKIQEILEDREILSLLGKQDDELLFYPHNRMQRFVPYFKASSERVKILSRDMADVQELLIQADILITDFSSVFFDFAYMGKPLIYYQFDREEYRRKHLKEGYFSFEKDGFGPVCGTREELFLRLKEALSDGFSNEPYKSRAEKFFQFRDRLNCRRNYQAVLSLMGEEEHGTEN